MALRLEKCHVRGDDFHRARGILSIISTLIMMATQKAREVAILKAMGALAVPSDACSSGRRVHGLIGLAVGVSPAWSLQVDRKYGLPLPTDVLLHQQTPGGDAAERDPGAGGFGHGPVLPGHRVSGVAGVTHASGRRVEVRVSALTPPQPSLRCQSRW